MCADKKGGFYPRSGQPIRGLENHFFCVASSSTEEMKHYFRKSRVVAAYRSRTSETAGKLLIRFIIFIQVFHYRQPLFSGFKVPISVLPLIHKHVLIYFSQFIQKCPPYIQNKSQSLKTQKGFYFTLLHANHCLSSTFAIHHQ